VAKANAGGRAERELLESNHELHKRIVRILVGITGACPEEITDVTYHAVLTVHLPLALLGHQEDLSVF
jgi:hypothetical protein